MFVAGLQHQYSIGEAEPGAVAGSLAVALRIGLVG
jgi:hypothetical protein